jgi:hypothetical protein
LINPKGTDNLENLDVDGKIILKRILRKMGYKGVNMMHLAQDRDQWWSLVNTVMNLGVPLNVANFFSS